MRRIFLIFVLVPGLLAAEDTAGKLPIEELERAVTPLLQKARTSVPTVSDWDLQHWLSGRENDADDTPSQTAEKDQREALARLLHDAPPALRATAAAGLLQTPGRGYAPLDLLSDLLTSQVPEQMFVAGQPAAINEALQKYVAFHRPGIREAAASRARYHHLREVTRIWMKFVELYAKLVPGQAEPAVEDGTLILRDPWVPKSSPTELIPYFAPGSDWVSRGDSLLAVGESGIVRIRLADLQEEMVPVPEAARDVDGYLPPAPSGFLFFGSIGRLHIGDLEGKTWRECDTLPYAGYAASADRAFITWSAPPHYLGALETDPTLAHDAAVMESLNTTLHVWFAKTAELKKIRPSSRIPFLDNYRFQIGQTLATSSGRLVVSAEERDAPLARHGRQRVFLADTPAATAFREIFATEPDDFLIAWSGNTGRILLLRPEMPDSYSTEGDNVVVDCALLYEPATRTIERLFINDSPLAWPRPRSLKGVRSHKRTRWELPTELKTPPPGTDMKWRRTFVHRDRLFILAAFSLPGREVSPRYALYRFTPGSPSSRRIPLQFAFHPDVQARLARLEKDGINPGSMAHLEPYPYATDHFLAVATAFGVFRIAWDDLEKHFRSQR